MKRNIVVVFLIVILVLLAGYMYIYKGHRNIVEEEVNFSVSSDSIFTEFQENETAANSKFLDKTIVVTGNVSSIGTEPKSLVLDQKIFASFIEEVPSTLHINSKVTIKGRLIGYDSLLEEIKLDQCTIVK